jgi:hypothetical protein
MKEHALSSLADGSVNPTASTLYRLYREWKTLNCGFVTDPYKRLWDKMNYYDLKGICQLKFYRISEVY